MLSKLQKKWVKALRSGKYKQAKEALVKGRGSSCSYCCLGVACSIMSKDVGKFSSYRNSLDPGYLNNHGLQVLGISYNMQTSLARMNDSGKSFKEIANYIEKELG